MAALLIRQRCSVRCGWRDQAAAGTVGSGRCLAAQRMQPKDVDDVNMQPRIPVVCRPRLWR